MMSEIKENAERGDGHDAAGEKSQLKTGHAQFQFLGRDAIKPAQTGDDARETTSAWPGLRGYATGQSDSEIVRQCGPPIWSEEPRLRQKAHQRAEGKGKERGINLPAQRAARRLKNQEHAKESDDDSFGPLAGRATEKNRKNR